MRKVLNKPKYYIGKDDDEIAPNLYIKSLRSIPWTRYATHGDLEDAAALPASILLQPAISSAPSELKWLDSGGGISGAKILLPVYEGAKLSGMNDIDAIAYAKRVASEVDQTAFDKWFRRQEVVNGVSYPGHGALELVSPEFDLISGIRGLINIPRKKALDLTRDLSKITDAQWDDAYNAAIKAGNMKRVQALRDAHFKAKAPNTVTNNIWFNGAGESTYTELTGGKTGLNWFADSEKYASNHGIPRRFYINEPQVQLNNVPLWRTHGDIEEYADKLRKLGIDENTIQQRINNIHREYPAAIGNGELVTRNNTTAKLADAITRDDAGNIIPLSLRDNFLNPDIRYNLSPARLKMLEDGLDAADFKAAAKLLKPTTLTEEELLAKNMQNAKEFAMSKYGSKDYTNRIRQAQEWLRNIDDQMRAIGIDPEQNIASFSIDDVQSAMTRAARGEAKINAELENMIALGKTLRGAERLGEQPMNIKIARQQGYLEGGNTPETVLHEYRHAMTRNVEAGKGNRVIPEDNIYDAVSDYNQRILEKVDVKTAKTRAKQAKLEGSSHHLEYLGGEQEMSARHDAMDVLAQKAGMSFSELVHKNIKMLADGTMEYAKKCPAQLKELSIWHKDLNSMIKYHNKFLAPAAVVTSATTLKQPIGKK